MRYFTKCETYKGAEWYGPFSTREQAARTAFRTMRKGRNVVSRVYSSEALRANLEELNVPEWVEVHIAKRICPTCGTTLN